VAFQGFCSEAVGVCQRVHGNIGESFGQSCRRLPPAAGVNLRQA
jgi:hypothetical protein